jgi:hypothetical protein
MANDLTPEITAEIRLVMERFGVQQKDLADYDLTDTSQVNRILESRGADIYLLCAIGSWKDTLSDEEVFRELRDWLYGGEEALRPNPSFGSVQT